MRRLPDEVEDQAQARKKLAIGDYILFSYDDSNAVNSGTVDNLGGDYIRIANVNGDGDTFTTMVESIKLYYDTQCDCNDTDD